MTHIHTDPAGWVLCIWDTDPELPDAVPYPDWPADSTPPAPGLRARIVDGALAWQDPRTLADLKTAKNSEINAARLTANQSGFVHQGKRIATDALSRGDLDAVAAIVARTGALPAGWPGAWKAIDNSFVLLPTVAAWDAFYAAMYAAGLANFATAQALKTQLAAATTPAEIDSITWPEDTP